MEKTREHKLDDRMRTVKTALILASTFLAACGSAEPDSSDEMRDEPIGMDNNSNSNNENSSSSNINGNDQNTNENENTNNNSNANDEPFAVDPADVSQVVETLVVPGISTELESADGRLTAVFSADAVSAPVQVTVGILDESSRPPGVVGNVYVFGPSGTTFDSAVRLRFRAATTGNDEAVRPVQVDPGVDSFAVLDEWAFAPLAGGESLWAGNVDHFSAFGLTNGSGPTLTNDSTPPGLAGARELLGARQLVAARESYLAAISADPSDLDAQFGAAWTRLLLLPEVDAIDDILLECDEPLFDVSSSIFGTGGLLEDVMNTRKGTANLTVSYASSSVVVQPNVITAILGESSLDILVRDLRTADADTGFSLELYPPSDSTYVDGYTCTVGGASDSTRCGMFVDYEPDAVQETFGSLYTEQVSGTIEYTTAGNADGEALLVRFDDVRLNLMGFDSSASQFVVVGEILMNGTLEDTVDTVWKAPSTVPLSSAWNNLIDGSSATDPENDLIAILDACSSSVTGTFVVDKLAGVLAELGAIRGNLEAIADNGDASTFLTSLPVGALRNGAPIPLSIVEVLGLLAHVELAEAAYDMAQQYSWLKSAPEAYVATVDPYYEEGETTTRRTVDPTLIGPILNSDFLDVAAPLAFSDAKATVLEALATVKAAFNTNAPAGALIDFQAPGASAGTAEIVALIDLLVASANTGSQALPQTPEYSVNLDGFFSNPPTRASLLSDTSLSALFVVTPANAGEFRNAEIELEEDVRDALIETVLVGPTEPSTIYCIDDAECTSVESYLRCAGSTDIGVCSEDFTTACDFSTNPCSGFCVFNTCELREPVFVDEIVVDESWQGDGGGDSLPTFINEPLLDELIDRF